MSSATRDQATTLGETLADFAFDLRFEDLPAAVVERLQLHILDLVGVCLVGARMPFADMLHATISQAGGIEESTAIGRSARRLPAPAAAFFAGGIAHGNEFDDTYPPGRWHASAASLPALLAVGEALDVDGKRFIAAAAAAMEVGCRLTKAAPGLLLRGFHSTATAGVLCSSLGAAKLMQLRRDQMAHALAIAGCFTAGTTEFLDDPEAWPKRIQVGYAAQGAVLAARAAQQGFKGPRTMLEGRFGYFRSHAGEGNFDATQVVQGLRDEWEIARIYPKRYPCDHIAQGYIDCAMALAREHAFAPEQIERVEVLVHPLSRTVMFEPAALRYAPSNGWSARWSMPFNLAVALTDRVLGLDSYTDQRARDPATRALMARVVAVEEPSIPFPGDYPAWVRLCMADGKAVERRQLHAAGSPANPMDAGEYERKFVANARRVLDARRTDGLISAMRKLSTQRSIAEVAALYS
jgi:2-methylcitrate dehydratase PrpD